MHRVLSGNFTQRFNISPTDTIHQPELYHHKQNNRWEDFLPQSECKYRAKLDKRPPSITHDLDADVINHGKSDNNAYTNSL